MWTKRTLLFILVVASYFCLSVSSCLAAPTTQDTLTISIEDWNRLKENSAAQKKALEESQKELTEAKAALIESQEALTEAKELLSISQMTSTEAQQKLISLLEESTMQRAELETLRQELNALKEESATASDALAKANQYLNDTKAEIEANEKAHRARETKLERQRLLWQIVSVILGGVAIAK